MEIKIIELAYDRWEKAKQRSAKAREENVVSDREEIEAIIDLGIKLYEAKQEYSSTIKFSFWLDGNGFKQRLTRDDRAAFIYIGKTPRIAREIMTQTDKRSPITIHRQLRVRTGSNSEKSSKTDTVSLFKTDTVSADAYLGQRFGKLKVIGRKRKRDGRKMLIVECECGRKIKMRTDNWRQRKSCGCLNKWSPKIAIKRLQNAIQFEINEFHKYEGSYDEYKEIMTWLLQEAQQLNSERRIEFQVTEACSTIQ